MDSWHPSTYAVDEIKGVIWKRGSHAVALGLAGRRHTVCPGYEVKLCQQHELPEIRKRIEERQEIRDLLDRLNGR